MQKKIVFTKDYVECLANSVMFALMQGKDEASKIDPDQVFLGVWKFVKGKPFEDIFWKMLGSMYGSDVIGSYIKKMYKGKIPTGTHKGKVKMALHGSFEKFFSTYSERGLEEFHFLVLLVGALPHLSHSLKTYLGKHKLDTEQMVSKIEKVIDMTLQTDMDPMEFFQMAQSMVKALGLNVTDLEMFFDMNQFEHLETMFNEAEVLDRDDSDVSDSNKDKDEKDEDKKLTIEYFATDLTNEATEGSLDPVIGRDKEIQQIIYTLMRKTKNNPLLIGEAGVGKTAVIEGLAQKIITKDVPQKIQNKRVMMLDMGSLIAGTKYRGEFESRLKAIVEEAVDPMNNIILFVDEIHTLIGAGSAEGTADAANILKPLLSRGKLQMIGATTFDEYQKYIEKDAALKRRFQEVHVDEPSHDETIQILTGLREKYEEYHGVKIADDAIEHAVSYSTRYIMNKHLPDKAIDLIDEACARVSTLTQKLEANSEYVEIEDTILDIEKEIEVCIEKQDYFKAAELKEGEDKLKKKMTNMRSQQALPGHLRPEVGKLDIGKVLSDKMGLPLEQVTESEITQLSSLDTDLKSLIFNQEEAVDAVVNAIRRNRISPVVVSKPIASFLFLGPSGVGKTYLAKLLAKEYFGDEKALIRVDMSELMEKHSVSKLIGSAPGYVGYEQGGMLTEQVRRKPYSVVLFDEIEKASPDVLNIMLQILDEGHLKDNKGRRIDFKNTIIIMTSNIGAEEFGRKQVRIGFDHMRGKEETDAAQMSDHDFELIKERVMTQVKDYMAPELINRLSGMIVFKPLSKQVLGDIFKKEVTEFMKTWKQSTRASVGLKFPSFGKKKIASIIDEIYDAQLGARPISRYIHDNVEPGLIKQVMEKAV